MSIGALSGQKQWDELKRVGTDPAPRVKSGWPELDGLLHRTSFGPGTFVLLAGRMHTRKTAVAMNLIANMLKAGVPVGLVGLDEGYHMYVVKLLSILVDEPHTEIDQHWGTPQMDQWQQQYVATTRDFFMAEATRPDLDDLSLWLDEIELYGKRPRVVFIDYLSLLRRGKYDGKDSTRIPRLCEDLQVWTNKHGLVTIALHQVGRQRDGESREHGHLPVTPEQMMYGGEQQADIILSTYRPALDPLGNMSQEDAEADGIDLGKWQDRVTRVSAFQRDTMLQLIKNRPGIRLEPRGIRLRSPSDSQRMEVVV